MKLENIMIFETQLPLKQYNIIYRKADGLEVYCFVLLPLNYP